MKAVAKALAVAASMAHAQTYPGRQVRIVVGYVPGGGVEAGN